MLLTKSQVVLFWRQWKSVCQAQGWTAEGGFTSDDITAKRREILASLGFDSLTKVDHTAGFDRLLARLRLLSDQLRGAMDEVDPTAGDRRRDLHRVETLMKCLRVYMDQPKLDRYIRTICSNKFPWRGQFPREWNELSSAPIPCEPLAGSTVARTRPSELSQLIMTLSARLNGKRGFRAEAGHSVHDMLTRAQLPCECAECVAIQRAARAQSKAVAKPARRAPARSVRPVREEEVPAENRPF